MVSQKPVLRRFQQSKVCNCCIATVSYTITCMTCERPMRRDDELRIGTRPHVDSIDATFVSTPPRRALRRTLPMTAV